MIHKHERGSHPPGGGQKKFFSRYGKKKFQKSAFLAGIDDVEEESSPDDEKVVDEEPGQAEESFDDEVEDEALADQLNALAEIEAANEGEIISAAACAATMQLPLQAYAAWDNVGIRRLKGKGQPRRGRKGNGRFGVRLGKGEVRGDGKGPSLEERKKRLQQLKKTTKCTACGQTWHWAMDPECPKKAIRPDGAPRSCPGRLRQRQ